MMVYRVRFLAAAEQDLKNHFDFISASAGEQTARDFIARLYGYCLGLDVFPERGTRRDDIREGLRLLGYRRQATVAFTVQGDDVVILRLLLRGRDIESGLESGD